MQLSASEAKQFWPIYNEYETKRLDIGDRRVKLLERFAAAYKRGDLLMQIDFGCNLRVQRAEITLREKYATWLEKYFSVGWVEFLYCRRLYKYCGKIAAI